MERICIFGDSITWGAVDPLGGGWANRLRNYFEQQSVEHDYQAGYDVDVYNLGISGNRTSDLIKRFATEAEAREPDVIVFAIGINDSQFVRSTGENRTPLEDFAKNINDLIKQAQNFTRQIVIVGLTQVDESKTVPVPWNADREYTNAEINRYDTVLQSSAKEHGLPYIELKSVVSTEELPDGVHPNSTGHQKIFECVRDRLFSLGS